MTARPFPTGGRRTGFSGLSAPEVRAGPPPSVAPSTPATSRRWRRGDRCRGQRDPQRPRRPVTTELAVTGMTCGTCAARIQRKLGRLPGVEASVNYATGRARVTHPPEQDPAELVARRHRPRLRRRTGGAAADPAAGGARPGAAAAPESTPRPVVDDPSRRPSRPGPRARRAAPPRAGLPRADAAGHRGGDEPRLAVPVLAVVLAGAHRARGDLGRLALPPRRGAPPAPPLGDDGHARLGGHARRVRLVAVDAVLRRRGARRDAPRPLPDAEPRPVRRGADRLPRDRGRDHHRGAARALDRAAGPASRARGVGEPARTARRPRPGVVVGDRELAGAGRGRPARRPRRGRGRRAIPARRSRGRGTVHASTRAR